MCELLFGVSKCFVACAPQVDAVRVEMGDAVARAASRGTTASNDFVTQDVIALLQSSLGKSALLQPEVLRTGLQLLRQRAGVESGSQKLTLPEFKLALQVREL
jgi:hypothetical protein